MNKMTMASFLMLVSLNTVYAQQEVEVQETEKITIAENLEKEAETGQHDPKVRKHLKKIAEVFRQSSQKVLVEVKTLDDCQNCEDKSKSEVVLNNVGRKLGRASAWISTTTAKPFMNATGFLKGVLEKKEKNQDLLALNKFFLNHSKEFDQLYMEAGTPDEMIELMLQRMEEIMEEKSRIIIQDTISQLGIKRELPENLEDFQLTDEEIASIDMEKLKPELINEHPEYQEVKPILGEVNQAELEDMILSGYFDKTIGFENYMAALPKIHEAGLTIVGQIFGPKVAFGVISKSLAGLYAGPVVLADVATGVSAAICSQEITKEKFEDDKDLKLFCSYVINRSAYILMKSRAKGYVAGKKAREKLQTKIQQRKEKRAQRRAERTGA